MKIRPKLIVAACLTLSFCAHAKTKIAFVINELSFRGIEVSTFDYAHFNETLLNNESIIINFDVATDNEVRTKFTTRFPAKFFDCTSVEEMDYILEREAVDILYFQKPGHNDGVLSKVAKNAVHAVFPAIEPHGDVYAYISEWFVHEFPQFNLPFVPYIVRVEQTDNDLRDELRIPHDALVFGRHGGAGSFNVPCAVDAVKEVAQARPDIYFLFLNTEEFCNMPNVIFLPKTTDMVYKAKFINSCDAMIHARWRGETFGLACAEFSIKNKPVITWTGAREQAHMCMLGDKALYYTSKEDLVKILTTFKKDSEKNWDAYSSRYSPQEVMKQFDAVFIQPLVSAKKSNKHLFAYAGLTDLPHSFGQHPLAIFDAQAGTLINDIRHCMVNHDGHAIAVKKISHLNNTQFASLYNLFVTHGYQFYIYNDSALAFKNAEICVDQTIRAMTLSRLCEIEHFAQRRTLHSLLAAEQIIARAYNTGCSWENASVHPYSIRYLNLWKGLAHLHTKEYNQAISCFEAVINSGYNHWRVYWYLGQARYKMGDIACMDSMATVLQACPQFEGITNFKKIINA